jgi:glycosyltransferase involved in cell wall biosynthesis
MKYSRIVFWQMTPSPHQAPWIRALSRTIPDCQIITVFQKDISPQRVALGWLSPDYGDAQIVNRPSSSHVKELLNTNGMKSVHVFSAMMADSQINSALNQALATDVVVGILSEGRDWRGYRGLARQIDAFRYERKYRNRVDFVLAIGQTGIRWYEKCGFRQEKIYPFCYVVEKPESQESQSEPNKQVQIVALGQLIFRKRFDLLIKALKECNNAEWQLKVIGDGKLRKDLEQLVRSLGFEDRIKFPGVIDNIKVRQELESSDLMVLPSRWDGWGAVVNEAMMSGVPVICSDYCGAADLVKPGVNGDVFCCDSLGSLTRTLNKWISQGPLSPDSRERLMHWSNCIAGETVAQYFTEIVRFVEDKSGNRPRPPWTL